MHSIICLLNQLYICILVIATAVVHDDNIYLLESNDCSMIHKLVTPYNKQICIISAKSLSLEMMNAGELIAAGCKHQICKRCLTRSLENPFNKVRGSGKRFIMLRY